MHHLSVQSHVCRDYVGNRSSATLLQCLQHEVDEVHTVDYASMYVHEGVTFRVDHIKTIFDGLWKAINTRTGSGVVGGAAESSDGVVKHNPYSCVLTGYTGDAEVLKEIWSRIASLKALPNPPVWIMDPCMGDGGRLYVAQAVRDFYVANCGKADILTPNEYELYWLTSSVMPEKLDDANVDTIRRIDHLHSEGVQVVIVTSVTVSENTLKSYVSVNTHKSARLLHTAVFPKLNAYLGGCGDAFNALLAHELTKSQTTPSLGNIEWPCILQHVLGRMHAIVSYCAKQNWTSIVIPRVFTLPYEPMEVTTIELQANGEN